MSEPENPLSIQLDAHYRAYIGERAISCPSSSSIWNAFTEFAHPELATTIAMFTWSKPDLSQLIRENQQPLCRDSIILWIFWMHANHSDALQGKWPLDMELLSELLAAYDSLEP